MNTGIKWRFYTIVLVFLLGVLFFVPNIKQFSWWPTKDKIRYGLDIQGGIYLVMGVDMDSMLRETANRLAGAVMSVAKDKQIPEVMAEKNPSATQGTVAVLARTQSKENREALRKAVENYYGTNAMVTDEGEKDLNVRFSDTYLAQLKKDTIDKSIETLRNRIDEFGVSEPSIVAQGENRILVQLPGIQDAAQAKELINRTARLEFHIVDTAMGGQQLATLITDAEKEGKLDLKTMKYSEYVRKLNEQLKGKLPAGTMVLFGKNENAVNMEAGKVPYLLKAEAPVAGDSLREAHIGIKQEYNEPYVSLAFNPAGAIKFADLTGASVGKNLAIVLDNVVYSAPNVRQKIAGGSAEITLGGGKDYRTLMADARTISMALNAGALPASLEQLEERSVGPTLGADSIAKGQKASVIAAILVILFMLVYYKSMGAIADVALGLNIFLMLCMLSALNATLTLPGIAGIALTIGVAVDANVIIFERIREELRHGASYKTAIDLGFDKAFWAIFDANICSAATSLILMHYGTGPVRGFAVTLVIGIFTSMFTAVFVTRTLIDTLVHKFNMKLSV